MSLIPFIYPNWSAPPSIGAYMTTRIGGCSTAPYHAYMNDGGGLNLGYHVGDDSNSVAHNRKMIKQYLPQEPIWLNQVHSDNVVEWDYLNILKHDADAIVTKKPQSVCAILTADCLPVLFCDKASQAIGAAHAGWRGLCKGILEKTAYIHANLANCPATQQIVWIGPAIGKTQFEIGEEVISAFITAALPNELDMTYSAFQPIPKSNKYLCDLYKLAFIRLRRAGIINIYSTPLCTVNHPQYFYSYRRDGITGRMASLIWLK